MSDIGKGVPVIAGFDLSRKGSIDTRMVVDDITEMLTITWLYKGLMVYVVADDDYYKYKGDTISNVIGDWVLWNVAAPGADGADGTIVYTGGSDPGAGVGNDGDLWIMTSDGASFVEGDLLKKVTGTWTLQSNLKGADGLDASAGYYGGILVENNSGGTPQSISTSYVQINQFNATGPSNGFTPSAGSDNITIDNAGTYVVLGTLSVSGSIGTFTVKPFVNAVVANGMGGKVKINSTSDVYEVTVQMIITLSAADVVDLRVKASAASLNFLVHEGGFQIFSMGAAGLTGAQGEALTVDEGTVVFSDTKIAAVEGLGGISDSNRYVLTVQTDTRTATGKSGVQRTAITGDMTDHMIAWNGADWFDYGLFRGPKGVDGTDGAKGDKGDRGYTGNKPEFRFKKTLTDFVNNEDDAGTGWTTTIPTLTSEDRLYMTLNYRDPNTGGIVFFWTYPVDIKGPQGPQGPQGPPGTPGAPGAPGEDAVGGVGAKGATLIQSLGIDFVSNGAPGGIARPNITIAGDLWQSSTEASYTNNTGAQVRLMVFFDFIVDNSSASVHRVIMVARKNASIPMAAVPGQPAGKIIDQNFYQWPSDARMLYVNNVDNSWANGVNSGATQPNKYLHFGTGPTLSYNTNNYGRAGGSFVMAVNNGDTIYFRPAITHVAGNYAKINQAAIIEFVQGKTLTIA